MRKEDLIPKTLRYKNMNIELSRFRVKEGQSKTVDEWMAFLNENMSDVLLTLDGERLHVETIFREKSGDAEYLYWYSIQSEGGRDVAQSESWIDKKHLVISYNYLFLSKICYKQVYQCYYLFYL